VTRLSVGDPATDGRLSQLTHAMLSKGATAWEAPRRALGLLNLTIDHQANLLSYIDAFRFVGFLSLACVPVILLAGRPGSLPRAAAAAAADSH